MNRRQFLCASLPLLAGARAFGAAKPPNIVYMYADDLGYGDASCYGATRGEDAEPGSRRGGRYPVHARAFLLGHLHALALFAADRRICLAATGHRGSARAMRR